MDLFLVQLHACICPKTRKYLQNARFSRKVHHDSPIEGRKNSNLYRPMELDELYRIDWFLVKFHGVICAKTAKYLQNVRFSLKLHHDSAIGESKISNLHRPIELGELYRMVMTSSGLNHWILSEIANPRHSARFLFFVKVLFFFEKHENCTDRTIFWRILYYRGNWWKMYLAYVFGLCCFPFICQRRGRERHHSIYYFITFAGISQFGDMQAWNSSGNESIR